MPYTGRFAPSPTGALHLGSLVAALGSFLDARHHGGRWLLRMEDLDTPRVLPGCADQMLRTLEAFALTWDGAVEYQSRRGAAYQEALRQLRAQGVTFECSCSRAERQGEGGYPGTCREGPARAGPTATRFRVDARRVAFADRIQGACHYELAERGDVIIRRRDGRIAYQLAVVLDDAWQGVTQVVRGADLLDSTPWQMALQSALRLPGLHYAHLPLVVEPSGAKLAKSRRAVALDPSQAGRQLHDALVLLQQQPPAELKLAPAPEILGWAVPHWDIGRLSGRSQVRAAV
ncbi:MAG: tRNA glutamyl-Q(34) synthetase GluQRS [Proteobacteria bacterium]|nr:tRNA glutamyl-Q(34) synthetase GluQRS [Pseudomonadota bacterium]